MQSTRLLMNNCFVQNFNKPYICTILFTLSWLVLLDTNETLV